MERGRRWRKRGGDGEIGEVMERGRRWRKRGGDGEREVMERDDGERGR